MTVMIPAEAAPPIGRSRRPPGGPRARNRKPRPRRAAGRGPRPAGQCPTVRPGSPIRSDWHHPGGRGSTRLRHSGTVPKQARHRTV
eukprot:417083-Hanusia_phi.AAC.1